MTLPKVHSCEGDLARRSMPVLLFTTLMISDVTLTPESVAADLRPVLLRLARELRKETEQLGITARQATFLWLVKRSPGLSLAELAAEEGISPPAMSGHVDRLERAGLLERERSSEDRRRVGLRLTDEGERLMRRVRARRTTWLAYRLHALEPDELEAVEAAIPALMRLVEPDA
jgi:DNA-binding MarR family transcriptional regulator